MARWLTGFRSSNAEASAEPQPFEVICECNVRHTGMRRKTHQRIICRTCGAALFVAPRDSYPPPSPPRVKKVKPAPPPEEAPEAASEGGGPSPLPKSRHRRRREQEYDVESHPLQSAAELASATIAGVAGAAGAAGRATVRTVSRASQQAALGFWRFWTPLRLTGLGIVVVLAGIVLWTMHARRLEQAARTLNPAIEAGQAALQKGDVPEAARQLTAAVNALDALGRDDEHSRAVRQAQREALALNELSTEPLLHLLETADESVERARRLRLPPPPDSRTTPPPLDAEWATRFAALYEGKWVVLEAPIKRLPATEQERRRYEVALPTVLGPQQRGVEIRADFEVFDRLSLQDSPRPAIFGGQLRSCRLSADERLWIVELDPASGFLWVSLATYRRLGFPFSEWHRREDVEQILRQQADALGVKPLIEDRPEAASPPNLAPG